MRISSIDIVFIIMFFCDIQCRTYFEIFCTYFSSSFQNPNSMISKFPWRPWPRRCGHNRKSCVSSRCARRSSSVASRILRKRFLQFTSSFWSVLISLLTPPFRSPSWRLSRRKTTKNLRLNLLPQNSEVNWWVSSYRDRCMHLIYRYLEFDGTTITEVRSNIEFILINLSRIQTEKSIYCIHIVYILLCVKNL